MKFKLVFLLFLIIPWSTAMADEKSLIFDFTQGQSQNSQGLEWEGFTDRVMGGLSEMTAVLEGDGNTSFMRMRGDISLKNNGGFIQTRLYLKKNKDQFDASSFSGIAITARGVSGPYYIHLRTPANWFPWSFYEASFSVTNQWSRILIPFSSFKGESAGYDLEKQKLISIAVFAGKKAFKADISVSKVEFY